MGLRLLACVHGVGGLGRRRAAVSLLVPQGLLLPLPWHCAMVRLVWGGAGAGGCSCTVGSQSRVVRFCALRSCRWRRLEEAGRSVRARDCAVAWGWCSERAAGCLRGVCLGQLEQLERFEERGVICCEGCP